MPVAAATTPAFNTSGHHDDAGGSGGWLGPADPSRMSFIRTRAASNRPLTSASARPATRPPRAPPGGVYRIVSVTRVPPASASNRQPPVCAMSPDSECQPIARGSSHLSRTRTFSSGSPSACMATLNRAPGPRFVSPSGSHRLTPSRTFATLWWSATHANTLLGSRLIRVCAEKHRSGISVLELRGAVRRLLHHHGWRGEPPADSARGTGARSDPALDGAPARRLLRRHSPADTGPGSGRAVALAPGTGHPAYLRRTDA